jgi:hypothetical protein
MSIMAMSRQAARTKAEAGDGKPLDSALAKIAAYIPSEVIATYLAVLGIWQPDSKAERWACFGVNSGLLAALCVLGWALQRQAAPTPAKRPTLQHLFWVFIIAAVAFVTYAMAVPGSAFTSVWSDATKFGGIAALLLAAVLPSFGKLVGVDPEA